MKGFQNLDVLASAFLKGFYIVYKGNEKRL